MAMEILENVEPEWVEKKMGVLIDTREGPAHQICSFMWADNHQIMSHPKAHLEKMMKDLMEEAVKWDLGAKTRKSVVEKNLLPTEMMEDIDD